ncbi:MAG: fatty acid hydroxylase [Candidatus Muproteobacteria bacterium RIFCSPHIGHO2_12_FULL_60_33]|uniref:Fatty acid hydroxylase n=1 Tax=Candidatus Muproteobacteria bacterium RIFCSPLOWO2_01_FULL_60_18 TaxID=1817768 RepID=A0A1F6TZB3_9PROT|nr:MAG: fatty acid hydroxylase [Candidatus Muproteobacteria bacterium RIFCSPLOWO2_01_FULL_60_18]OGI52402.1 MAG: fatty acid hydroxylase [Candidatus Muproteobacteria bacterium RIFCSPHIGHO2_01_60_12]OGI54216.1 MAG: fatty acid hydroxylase [Candidatus Muproteobacteria bacterium RIFCSPHIGHO2_12_FULL_60_33]OGI55325.1 MAG: fatty acid hydroxylase [Candidatus Muproteobacteria bacterium RIFCSPHIGHO2_02_FULL_60_13]OGI59171.1 MAG: fatty acid hydroxylase [Candidatus Muproteobacteria bacterium RIFCSPHIGHO2_01
MTEFILNHDPAIRLSIFLGILAAMVGWEFVAPRRALILARPARWTANLGIVFLNSALLRVVFPAGAVGVAALASGQGWGLFSHFTLPYAAAVLLSVIALDFAIYLQHVMFHAVPALWRLHRMHHADLDFDVTTGLRFHSIEIVLSMLIKFAVIVVLGAPVLAVIVFEVLLNATAMFNHSNVRIPLALDRFIRRFVVTPDMHRVHHSILGHESNSNFGFNLPLWDRLFGTYRDQPELGHEKMTIGIRDFRAPQRADRLAGMPLIPFRGTVTGYAINRRDGRPAK